MQTILESQKGLSVLASIHVDRVITLAAVGGALFAGGWLCMVALALH
jgi:hypothetical protein